MKRSPLSRRTPLRAKTGLRRTRIRPKRKTPTETAAWDTTRIRLYARAGGRCERCGTDLNHTGMDAHHRKLRSRGGGDELSNLAALCPTCHRKVHAYPLANTIANWMVSRTGNPAALPVVLHDDRVVYLDNTGTYTEGCAA